MIQYYSITRKIPEISPVRESRKVRVETILKQLEYVTKGNVYLILIWLVLLLFFK